VYAVLLVLYPATLRTQFGREMAEAFEDQLCVAWTEQRWAGLLRVWSCASEEFVRIALPGRLALMEVAAASFVTSFGLFLFLAWALNQGVYSR
jgi:hypothetical protein